MIKRVVLLAMLSIGLMCYTSSCGTKGKTSTEKRIEKMNKKKKKKGSTSCPKIDC